MLRNIKGKLILQKNISIKKLKKNTLVTYSKKDKAEIPRHKIIWLAALAHLRRIQTLFWLTRAKSPLASFRALRLRFIKISKGFQLPRRSLEILLAVRSSWRWDSYFSFQFSAILTIWSNLSMIGITLAELGNVANVNRI